MLQAEVVGRKIPRIRHSFCCVECVYEPETDSTKKLTAIYKRGKLRIMLEPIALTMFKCPKCGRVHLSKEFSYTDTRKRLAHRFKRHVKQLIQTYH